MPDDFGLAVFRVNTIQALRERGVNEPGLAERVVDHHGPEHVSKNLHKIEDLLAAILGVDRKIEKDLQKLIPPTPKSSKLQILDSKGKPIMPLTVHVNDIPGNAVFLEFAGLNQSGQVITPKSVNYSSDNAAVATVDPATGALTYVASGTANIKGSDPAFPNLDQSDVLTVTDPTPQSSSLTLNPGVPATTTAAARRR